MENGVAIRYKRPFCKTGIQFSLIAIGRHPARYNPGGRWSKYSFIGVSLILNEHSIEAGARSDGQERERRDKPRSVSEAFIRSED